MSKVVVLYHVGARPAAPKPSKYGETWHRQNRMGAVREDCVVFLTPNPVSLAGVHGLSWVNRRNVYAYRVPMALLAEIGGLHRYDSGTEVMIPEYMWGEVKFLGRSPKLERQIANGLARSLGHKHRERTTLRRCHRREHEVKDMAIALARSKGITLREALVLAKNRADKWGRDYVEEGDL